MKKFKNSKFAKRLTAGLATTLFICQNAIAASAQQADGWNQVTTWGNSLADNLKGLGKVVAIIAMVILGISCAAAGRGWSEKLKTGGSGILVAVIIISYGTSIVAGLFA